jgi:trimethylamine--corrinoid protein Co-methyltransferase
VTLCGQAERHDLVLAGNQVHVGTGGAAPSIVDIDTGNYRDSSLHDLHQAARLADALPHVHFFSRSLVARDMPTAEALEVNTAFACLAGTAKHVCVSASSPRHVELIASMCHMVAGSKEAFLSAGHSCLSTSITPYHRCASMPKPVTCCSRPSRLAFQ